MSRSFYLAASSGEATRLSTQRLMRELVEAGWSNGMDWTTCIGAAETHWSVLAESDIKAAVEADLFVLLDYPQSYGAMVELGARLGAGKRAHVVGDWASHFFYSHPLVTKHASWEFFLARAAGGVA